MGARCCPFSTWLLLLTLLRAGSGVGSVLPPDPHTSPERGSGRNPLAQHFGKARLLVIAAPGPWDTSYRLMQKQVDLNDEALRCELALRDLLVLLLFQSTRPSQGKLLRASREGKVVEERLRAEAVKQVTRRLSLESQFGMVLLKKSLQVYERFPYAVRMEAVLETVDQMPLRKVESMTRRASQLKCKGSRAGRPSGQVHTTRDLANRTVSIRTVPNRTMFIRTVPNRSMANRTMFIRTVPNRSMANRTMFIRTVPKGYPVNATMRQGMSNSRKAFRSPGGKPPQQPGMLAPGERSRGKQKALTSSQGLDGQRKVKPPRSPPSASQETVDHLMGQIRQRVRQRMAANARHPLQRKYHGGARNGSQVFDPDRVLHHSSGGPTLAARGDSGLISPTAERVDEGGPERATTLGSDLSTAGSQAGHHNRQRVSAPPSPTSPTPLPHPGGAASVHAAEVQPTSTESPQARRGRTEPPHPSRAPAAPRPTGALPREKGSRKRGGGQPATTGPPSQPPPPSAQPKAKKGKGEGEENSGKRSRGKGRKNRKNRKNRKQGSRKKAGGRQLLAHFRNRRRLLVITAPSKDSRLYVQQRDDYLEHVCHLAIRHISVVIVLGSPTNSMLTIEHYQTENERVLENPEPEPVSADLIAYMRKEFGMSFNEFFMVLVDYDMKVKQFFDVPIPIKVLVDYMDTFPSRLPEIQEEKRNGVTCLQREGRVNINKLLSRLQGKRRLLIISTPYEEEWTFQQQILALNGQECNLGIRHFAMLKLTGSGEEASGSLELFPANGRSRAQREKLSSSAVNALREHFQVSEGHFMMLLVGKDGAITSWYLSPVWSLATIYDQVDSTQLRQDEMKLHEALGVHCHEEEHSPSSQGYPQRG